MPSLDLFHPLRYWHDEPPIMPHVDSAEAQGDAEDSLSDRYAFALGADIALFRQHAPEECESAELHRGYRHGLNVPGKHANIYQRKLLQVRRNALRRSIPVSSRMTEEYLRGITVTVCPVSGVELSQGTKTESDWSIDRLNNKLGYVPGNVCVLSTRVNELKSSDHFLDVSREAALMYIRHLDAALSMDIGNGLMVLEAFRIAALMAAPSAFGDGKIARYAPHAMAPDVVTTVLGGLAGIHVGCARTRLEGRAYRRRADVLKHLGGEVWRTSNRLVEQVRSLMATGMHPCDIWHDADATERLEFLYDAFHASPPEIPMSAEEALRQLKVSMSSLSAFHRARR